MKFTEILEELRKGKKVTREKWEECKTECYKYIKLEHGEIIAYLKDDNGEDKVEERTKCMFELVDFTAEDWNLYKEPTKNWKPKEGDTIFYISGTGKVINDTFMPCLPSDNDKVLFNNAFKTAEEAEHMVEKIKIINKLRELSNIKFNETDDRHYMIVYHKDDREIISDFCYSLNPLPFNVYFETREDCQKAIEIIGEENLKKYYFDIVEEDN